MRVLVCILMLAGLLLGSETLLPQSIPPDGAERHRWLAKLGADRLHEKSRFCEEFGSISPATRGIIAAELSARSDMNRKFEHFSARIMSALGFDLNEISLGISQINAENLAITRPDLNKSSLFSIYADVCVTITITDEFIRSLSSFPRIENEYLSEEQMRGVAMEYRGALPSGEIADYSTVAYLAQFYVYDAFLDQGHMTLPADIE